MSDAHLPDDKRVAHIPGPWTVEEILDSRTFDAECAQVRLVHAPGGDIAYVAHYSTDGDVARQTANARLIAAAPEMLAMLKRVLGSQWTGDDVRAVIAKAEGRKHG